MRHYQSLLPSSATLWVTVWRRNFLVWRKLAPAAIVSHLVEPMIYLFGLGVGLGMMVGTVNGSPYIAFLAAGTLASSVMFSASFEVMYGVFARVRDERVWESIMHTPLTLSDIVLAEVLWATSKAALSGFAILVVALGFGYARWSLVVWVLPVIVLSGLTFASAAMIMAAVAPHYDFFLIYDALVLTPMLLFSGVFFPISQLPPPWEHVAGLLPLAHAVALIRPAMLGHPPEQVAWHVGSLLLVAMPSLVVAMAVFRRRLLC
ncbi:nodulation protein NodJ [Burkholderia sp. Bp9126]|nr:nodulation protein NodJ [Burkholderia sp. Bp9126]